jgi:hypothetical protein
MKVTRNMIRMAKSDTITVLGKIVVPKIMFEIGTSIRLPTETNQITHDMYHINVPIMANDGPTDFSIHV